jgi:hypothetical protein
MKAQTKKKLQAAENWLLLGGFLLFALYSEGAIFLYLIPWLILGILGAIYAYALEWWKKKP